MWEAAPERLSWPRTASAGPEPPSTEGPAQGRGSHYVITDRGGVTYLDVLAYCSHESVCLQFDAAEGGILKPEVLVQQPQHSSVVEGHAPLQQLHDVIITS